MAAGVPAISADFPVWRQIVEGAACGFCVDPLNPGQISLAIRYLFTHPREAESMGRRGRRAIEERFNWDREKRSATDRKTRGRQRWQREGRESFPSAD